MTKKIISNPVRQSLRWIAFLSAIFLLFLILLSPYSAGRVQAQFPTVNIPTVTGSPQGAYIIVLGPDDEPANIRSGPNTTYARVGVMQPGQTAPALGRSGNFIKIVYPGPHGDTGWIYIPKVRPVGDIPEIAPPPTNTPSITLTIDPTLAAQFSGGPMPTNLPTFTEPPPLLIPTFQEISPNVVPGGIPVGMVIVVLFGLGLFLTLVSILRRG